MSETQRTKAAPSEDLAAIADAQLAPLRQLVEGTFAEMGQSITEDLARVSLEGRQSMNDLVEGMLEDLARLAAERLIQDPLQNALGSFFGGGQGADKAVGNLIKGNIRNG
ncbi:MAG: hypothetical protein AAF368_10335 [Planctomycetota bacterium]